MRLIKSVLKYIFSFFYRVFLFFELFRISKKRKIIVFDIDNTIADTWVTLRKDSLVSYKNEYDRNLQLALIDGAYDLVNHAQQSYNHILFLSARDPRLYFTTRKWINKNFSELDFTLVLVPNVKMKLMFWKCLSKIQNNLVVIDDLSYNHENNDIKFYQNEIYYLTSNDSIKYFGLDEINKGLKFIQEQI